MTQPLQPPIITTTQLGTYLADNNINVDRATMMISDAMTLAAAIFSPNVVPAQAAGVIRRMAGRGYVTTTSSRAAQVAGAGSPMGATPGGMGGVIITRMDRTDLEAINSLVYQPVGSSGAFSIDVLGPDYALSVSPWDSGLVPPSGDGGVGTDDQDYG